ncbi:esterase-like activity of phytase family protein [Sphingomonas psychrotolerans]|uniref:Esterase-like activity of phytase family protein n=1 Tax=Sphingomonas psychrotolerans TaxID=1327635 RepID=A0ABU3N3N1_9SPHN|nr:esterase-like activity of phytase family protein [Sphingomonas psychrotolerans]MDT8759008.1 esterase-like activity of phytase family protein [Sphingomonas psychrotolerans]
MRFAVPLSSLLMLSVTASGIEPRAVLGDRAEMVATQVPLDPSDPSGTRVGALTYLGGLVLKSRDPAFGGFSAMRVAGERFTLLSDGGNLVSFRMGADLRPADVRFADLPGPGTGAIKRHRDSESLTWDPATGRAWVGFENRNAIWRYDASLTRAERAVQPAAMADWSIAGGAEAMVRLRSGQFLVISETARPKGMPNARIVLRFAGDPTETKVPPQSLAYVPPANYDPTDMAELPDGRLLVLNRRLSLAGLFTAKLVLLDLRGARPGTAVHGRELATFERPVQHDNFEALALTSEGGNTIVWIASDDNGEIWEQSLLLKFRLDLPGTQARGQAAL